MKDKIHAYLGLEPLDDKDWETLLVSLKDTLSFKTIRPQKGKINSHYGKKHTEETKIILSEKAKARKTQGMKNKKHTEETKLKISIKAKGRISPMKNKLPWNKGLTLSEETKNKISQKKTGTFRSDETKKKISESSKNKKRITCEKCQKTLDASNYSRWHGERCRHDKTS